MNRPLPVELEDHMDRQQHAASTRDVYAAWLDRLGALDASPDEARDVIKTALTWAQGKSLGTVLPLRAALKHWLVSVAGWRPEDAEAHLPKAKGTRSAGRMGLARAELDAYYKVVDALPPGGNRTILQLLPRTGMRISEACGLRIADYRTIQGTPCLMVIGKGSKERAVHLSTSAQEIVEAWIKHLADEGFKDGFMFRGYKGAIKPDSVRVLVRRIAEGEFGPSFPGLSPHVLRHTWASGAVRAGVDLKRIQNELGHESLATTSKYVHAFDDKAQADMDKAENWR